MKLRLDQLEHHLQRALAPIYLLSGDDMVLVEEALGHITRAAQTRGFDEVANATVENSFDWDEWLLSTRTRSLFATKQMHLLRINNGKPGDKGSKALQQYCTSLLSQTEDSLLIIITPKLDAASLKTKWCQAIDTNGTLLQIWPLDAKAHKIWFLNQMKRANLLIDSIATDWLIQQTSGNLLATRQIIEQLKLLFQEGDKIQLADLQESISDQSEFTIFDLVDSCNAGDAKNCLRILQRLQAAGTESILILWALTRELRMLHEMREKLGNRQSLDTILREARVPPMRKQVIHTALQRMKENTMYRLLSEAASIDATIKGANTQPLWPVLEKWCLSYCGAI